MIVDPVCGTVLDGFEYPEMEEYEGRLYYFESLDCAQKFRANPEKYVAGREEELGEPIGNKQGPERQPHSPRCAT